MVRVIIIRYYISIGVKRVRKEGEPTHFYASVCTPNTEICTCEHVCLYICRHKMAKVKSGL